MPTGQFDQYSTAAPLLGGTKPAWVADDLEAKRIASYQLYEMIYWTMPDTFKLTQRGEDANPIYIPSGKVIVETAHRYLAPGMKVIVDPELGDDNQKLLAQQVWTDLSRRERFFSKFSANKRYGLIRGDQAWHIYADPTRPAGSRVSVFPLDPGGLFAIYNEENLDEIIGWHVVEQFQRDGDNKMYMRRLTYRKTTGKGGPSPITVEDAIFEMDAWGGPNMDEKQVQILRPPTQLPSPIDQLPIYTIPNLWQPGALWGSSEMRGLEVMMAGINQGASDEDIALALEALGCYATNAGAPLDPDTGEELPWNLGPGRVVQVPPDAFFNRIAGVDSVTPYQDHLKYLHEQVDLASGTPAVAKGKVDVAVAESGIALAIQMGPLTSRMEEKETMVTDVTMNLLFDLPKWYVAFEGTAFNSLVEATRLIPVYGPRFPQNVDKKFDNLLAAFTAKVLPLTVVWAEMRKLGWELPDDTSMMSGILSDTEMTTRVEVDAMASRINGELEAAGNPTTTEE